MLECEHELLHVITTKNLDTREKIYICKFVHFYIQCI